MLKILLNGYNGRLGRAITEAAMSNPEFCITAGVDLVIPQTDQGFPVYLNTDINKCSEDFDVIIDCTTAATIMQVVKFAELNKKPIVICTTAIDDETMKEIIGVSKKIPVLKSANMSLGVNLMSELLKKAAQILGESGFDIEIIEKHHNKKIDAPSGTALLLADAINSSMDNRYEYVYDRTQIHDIRKNNEIGISSIRGGNIIGEHSVIFAGNDELIEIKHQASSKIIFAQGALKAAEFIAKKSSENQNGMYDMSDVINK